MTRRFIDVATYTWSKDSHGLFDYESSLLFTNNFKIYSSYHFFRKKNEILSVDASSLPCGASFEHYGAYLFTINQDPTNSNRFYISAKTLPKSSSNIDLVVRAIRKDGQPKGYDLKVGDIIKVGRVKFWVRESRDANGAVTKLKTVQPVNFLNNKRLEEGVQEINCRICFLNDQYPDPLVSPCKCSGSCEFVHLKCLKQWLDSKKSHIENSESVCLSFNFKKLSCEICKEKLPYTIKLGAKEFDVIDIKKPDNTPYIILEKIESGKEHNGLFLVKASNQEIRLGRGHMHQIMMSDISVSRNHAKIVFKDGEFLIFDNNSKFGTLVQMNKPIELSSEKTILQCGKTVVMLSMKTEGVGEIPNKLGLAENPVVNSPETPSTMNEQDQESKLQTNRNGSGKTELVKGEHELLLRRETSEIGCGLLPNSKKIFKIIRTPVNNSLKGKELQRKNSMEKNRKGKNSC